MTANELRTYFNTCFGIERAWPSKFEVDADTYGHCCQAVIEWTFNKAEEDEDIIEHIYGYRIIRISFGPNKGLMFKGVELILRP